MPGRQAHEAGNSWRKWSDTPAVEIERRWAARQRRERRVYAATVWLWCLVAGAWAAIALVSLGGKP